jgi:hypothetical protein
MYTTELANQLKQLLTHDTLDDFFGKLQEEATTEEFEPFVSAIEEEWRKLQIAIKNGLMNEEQAFLALTAFFNRESKKLIDNQTSDS